VLTRDRWDSTRNLSKRVATDLRFRPRGNRDRLFRW